MAEPIIELREVNKSFGAQRVLAGINLQIYPGEIMVVMGGSGCGKSTLLRHLIGSITPEEGSVTLFGEEVTTMGEPEMDQIRKKFGILFQSGALFNSLSIGDNVALPLREHTNLHDHEINEIVSELVGEVGLPQTVLTKKPVELSGGMRKRAGLARALALDPQLILYDEPTTGLDPIMSDVINELILRVRQRPRTTSVVVTHDMRTAHKVADRIVMLYPLSRLGPNEPQIIFSGTPAELDQSEDSRVRQFVEGRAGHRLDELREEQARGVAWQAAAIKHRTIKK